MQVTPIYFSGIFSPKRPNRGLKKDDKTTRTNRTEPPRLEVPKPKKPEKNGVTAAEFVKDGGKLWFDTARVNYEPFDGIVTYDSEVFHSSSTYREGKKDFLFVFLRDEDKMSIFAGFEKTEEINNNDGGQTIYYETPNHDCLYVEDYGPGGKLQFVNLERYDETPENKGKFISRTSVTFDTSGTKVIATDVKVGDEYVGRFGYTEKKTKYDNDKKVYEEKFNVRFQDFDAGKHATIYDEKGFAKERIDYDCKFYLDDEMQTPYAICSKRDTIKSQGVKAIRFKNYETIDWAQGINPLRQLVYGEHRNTDKYSQDNTVIYADSETNQPYAVETYDENGYLVEIENHDDMTLTTLEYRNNGSVAYVKNNASGKVIEKADFAPCEIGIKLRNWDKYDPYTGRKLESVHYRGNTEERYVFNPDGNGMQYIAVDGFLQSETYMGEGSLKRKLFSKTGETAYISKTKDGAKKAVYGKDKLPVYIDEYIDDIAVKRTRFKDGKAVEEILFENGFPNGDRTQKRVKLDLNNIY